MYGTTRGFRTQQVVSLIFFVVLGLCGSTACSTEVSDRPEPKSTSITTPPSAESPVVCQGLGEFEPKQAVMFLIDRTGSFFTNAETLGHIKAEAQRYTSALPPGSAVYMSYISDASARPEELALSDAIPPFDEHNTACEVSNVFDRGQRRQCAKVKQQQDQRHACVYAAHRRIEQAIHALRPATAPATDVTGALLIASETLAAYGAAERALVIFSDAVDTKGLPLPAQLAGFTNARIVIRPPLGQADADRHRPLHTYHTALSQWGGSVAIIPLNVTVTPQLFTPPATTHSNHAAVDLAHR